MVWSEAQRRRLAKEEEILNGYFPDHVQWFNRERDNMKVEIRMTTNNGKSYTLRVCIPEDYPNSCPNLYVCHPPRPLRDIEGNVIQVGTDFHSYGTNEDGLTTICHFVPSQWTNEYTLYQVFMKGRIWLEAYEIHLRTGKLLKDLLREMISPDSISTVAFLQGILTALGEQSQATSTSAYPQPISRVSPPQSEPSCLLL